MLRVGVRQVHCRFLSPKFLNPCFLGVNIGSRDELGAVRKDKNGNYWEMSEEEVKKHLKVASLHYLSVAGMAKSLGMTEEKLHASHCTGCLDYHNPFDMRPYDSEYSKVKYLVSRVHQSKRIVSQPPLQA